MLHPPLRLLPLLAALYMSACSDHNDASTVVDQQVAQAMSWLQADGNRIADELGRTVLLRGFNHIGLRSDRNHPPYRDEEGRTNPAAELFELQDIEDSDFAAIAGMGLNSLRLVVTWEFAQPDPPPAPYNEAYFRLIDNFIAKAKAHGLYVIFDFGQFGWGRAAGGNAGAPAWTISDTCASLPGPTGSAPPQASASVSCNYFNFWQNDENNGAGLQDHYVNLWRFVAQRYRDEPAIAMYDLLNEPFGGPIPPGVFELQFMFPFYQRLSAAIREIDPRHAIAFQPELLHAIGVPTPVAAPIGIDNAIYIPHEYTASYFIQRVNPAYTPLQDPITQLYLNIANTEAQIFSTPWMIGETGWTRSTEADGVGGPIPAIDEQAPRDFARDFTRAADAFQIGWQWFAYSSIDEAYGINFGGELDDPLIRELARPFPRAVGGELIAFSFAPETGIYQQQWRNNPGGMHEIALPMAWHYPDGICITVDDAAPQYLAIDGSSKTVTYAFEPTRQTLIYSGSGLNLRIHPGLCD